MCMYIYRLTQTGDMEGTTDASVDPKSGETLICNKIRIEQSLEIPSQGATE